MADVKTLTIHGTTYDIKDETARNAITELENDVTTLKSNTTTNTSDIKELTTRVSTAEENITDLEVLPSIVSSNTDDIEALDSFTSAMPFYSKLVNSTFNFWQRNQSNFTFNGSSGYTVDMWYILNGNGAVVTPLGDYNGVIVDNTSGTTECYFKQKFSFNGTYSIALEVTSYTGDVKAYFISTKKHPISKNGRMVFTDTGESDAITIELAAGAMVKLKYVDAFYGEYAYAHVDEPAELNALRCERYLFRRGMFFTNSGYIKQDGNGRMVITLPVIMHGTISVTHGGTINAQDANGIYGEFTVNNNPFISSDGRTITVDLQQNAPTSLSGPNMCTFYINSSPDNYIQVSCEPTPD